MSGGSSKPLQWTMGEQPNWIGVEQEGELPDRLLAELLAEGMCKSLLKRGYGIAPLPGDITESSIAMDAAMKAFCLQAEAEKVEFVSLSGCERRGQAVTSSDNEAAVSAGRQKHSPNEYHGFARVEGLKEQFMIRIGGAGSTLFYPGSYPVEEMKGKSPDFGLSSVSLYQTMDQLCRGYLQEVAAKLKIDVKKLDTILDPVIDVKSPPRRQVTPDSTPSSSGSMVVTGYHADDYISSSLLDIFHYFPRPKQECQPGAQQTPKRHRNNHLSHTDSGIITGVLSCAEPGLEVYDQFLEKWICLEQLVYNTHETANARDGTGSGRGVFARYVMAFLGDSCIYLAPKDTKPCLHRVSCSRPERRRFSYVFKMRTRAEATAPRYQEDYILADIQRKALIAAGLQTA